MGKAERLPLNQARFNAQERKLSLPNCPVGEISIPEQAHSRNKGLPPARTIQEQDHIRALKDNLRDLKPRLDATMNLPLEQKISAHLRQFELWDRRQKIKKS